MKTNIFSFRLKQLLKLPALNKKKEATKLNLLLYKSAYHRRHFVRCIMNFRRSLNWIEVSNNKIIKFRQ